MKRVISLLWAVVILSSNLYSQTAGDYRSKASDNWSYSSTWQRYNGSSWVNASSPPSHSDGVIEIQYGHQISVNNDLTIDQLIINGTLIINNGITLYTNNGIGDEITINGTMWHTGYVSNPMNGNGKINENGTYIHGTGGSGAASRMLNFFTNKHNNSNWIYRNAGSYTFAGASFGNLALETASGSYTMNFSGSVPMTVNGYLSIGPNVTFNVSNTGEQSIKSDIIVDGALNLSTGIQTIALDGSSVQTIRGSGTLNFEILNINNLSDVIISRNITVLNELNFTNGRIILGSNDLTLGSSASITGYGSGSYIVTNSSGQIIRNTAAEETHFPVGTSSSYNPVILINNGTAVNFGVNVSPSFTNPPPDLTKVVLREWNITPSASGYSNVTVKLQFNDGEYGVNFNPSGTVQLGHYNGSIWEGKSASVTGSNPYLLTANSINSFSKFTAGMEGALPVKLSYFTYTLRGRNVKLNWATSFEENNAGFEIQRADADQVTENGWKAIGFVKGSGITTTPSHYTYEDTKLISGKYRYRLKQTDNNGNSEYHLLSSTVEIGLPEKFSLSQNYPNPFNPVTKIDFELPLEGNVKLIIYDILGREAASVLNENRTAGYHTVQFDGSRLSSGIYFYRLTVNTQGGYHTFTRKMLLLK